MQEQEYEQTLALQKAKSLLDRTTDYNKFLEQRLSTAEAEIAQQHAKLLATINLLKKAKEALQQRKVEMDILKLQNNCLKQELDKKTQDLKEEMLHHDQTLRRLTELNAQLKVETIELTAPEQNNPELEQYFVYNK